MSTPELENRLRQIESATAEVTAQGMLALLLAAEILPLIAVSNDDPEALLEHVQRSTRGRIEPLLGQAQMQGPAERALALLGQVIAHAARPFRKSN